MAERLPSASVGAEKWMRPPATGGDDQSTSYGRHTETHRAGSIERASSPAA